MTPECKVIFHILGKCSEFEEGCLNLFNDGYPSNNFDLLYASFSKLIEQPTGLKHLRMFANQTEAGYENCACREMIARCATKFLADHNL